jgi:hypothetical protein
MVQMLTHLATAPALFISAQTAFGGLREGVGTQPFVLQVAEIMLLMDLVQY